MSSRGGARAKGTDGSDFGHRETVASHYQISSLNKRRLKATLFFHAVLFLYVLVKLSAEILHHFDINLEKIYKIKLPKPVLWEWIWLSSIIFLLAAYIALRKNNGTAMKVYAVGTFLCGICPLVAAIIYHSGDLKIFLMSKSDGIDVEKFNGIPVVLIACIFVTVTFLTHSLSLIFAMNLIRAWEPKKGKKKA